MKKKKNVFEIYLTSAFVESKQWLQLIYKISKINGKFKSWNLWINIENNYIRYFVETNTMLPPILGELGEFLIITKLYWMYMIKWKQIKCKN